MNTRLLLMLAGAAAAVWAFNHWRRAVKIAMVLLIVEGGLRKWVFPEAQDLLYFAKDVLLVAAYLGFLRQWPRVRYRLPHLPLFYAVLGLAMLLGVLQIFNPRLPNPLVGVFGFKAYFLYVPLMFVLPAVFESDADVFRFLRRYALLAIPLGVLALLQFTSPASSALNTYARSSGEVGYIATFGSSTHVRVTGTFAFITGYTAYLLTTAILILTLLGASGWRLRGSLFLYAGLGMTLLGMLMSGSRGPVLLLALLLPVYWWFAVVRERGSGATFGRLLLAVGLLAGFMVFVGEDALSAFIGRAAGHSDVPSRLTSPLLSPYLLLPATGVLGYGIGATHQTAAAVAPSLVPYSWLHGLVVEVESGRVMIELGPLGFLFVYFLRLFLLGYAFVQVRRLRTRFHRALALTSLLIFLAQLPGGSVFDVTAGVYYWFAAGLLLLAGRLDEVAVRAALAAAAQPVGRPPARPYEAPAPVPARPAAAWLPRTR